MDNTKLARLYDPSLDRLVVARDILVGDKVYTDGDPAPVEEFTEPRLRTLIRSRHVRVIFGDRPADPAPVETVIPAPVAPVVVELRCEFPGCKKPGPFATKAALGAHKRVHR